MSIEQLSLLVAVGAPAKPRLPPDHNPRLATYRRRNHLASNYGLRARRITTSAHWAIEFRPSHTRPRQWLPAVDKAGTPKALRFGTLRRRRRQWARRNLTTTSEPGPWAWLPSPPTETQPEAPNAPPHHQAAA